MGLFSKIFNKKSKEENQTSNDNTASNEDKKDLLDTESIPAIGVGATGGALAASSAVAAGMLLSGVAVVPLALGFPVIAGGIAVGAVGGKVYHSLKKRGEKKKQQKKQGPKGPSA